jgi:hypothetical protein
MPPEPVNRKTGPKIQKTSFFYSFLEFLGISGIFKKFYNIPVTNVFL